MVKVYKLCGQVIAVEFVKANFRVFNKVVGAIHERDDDVFDGYRGALVCVDARGRLQTEGLCRFVPDLEFVPLSFLDIPVQNVDLAFENLAEQEVGVNGQEQATQDCYYTTQS